MLLLGLAVLSRLLTWRGPLTTLAHMGISISTGAIEDTVTLLSAEAAHTIRALGQTGAIGYAYDNCDVDLKKKDAKFEDPNS